MENRKYLVALFLAVAFILTPSASWRIAIAQTAPVCNTVESCRRELTELERQLILLQLRDNSGAWCYTFNTNLSIGTINSEVQFLRTALEKEGFVVNERGDFNYYGESTASAVSGFQEKYRSQILTPLGLANPTGYFGPATRAVMNRLYGCDKDQTDRTNRPPPATPSLTVTAPAGGSYAVGASVPVAWTSANISSGTLVNLYLFDANNSPNVGAPGLVNTANDGSATLTLRSDAPAGQYRVRITATVNGQTITGYSNWFNVTSTAPTVTYTLTTNRQGATGAVSPSGINSYSAGAVVTLTAFPFEGYSTFTGWSGSITGTTNPITITMNGNKTVTANFTAVSAPPPATLSLTVSSPITNSTWSPTNSPVVSWTTVGVPDSQDVLIELLTPSGGSVPGFTSRSVRNDQRPTFNLLTGSAVASGSYYFRLSTVVNGQTISASSGVFQFTGASQTTPPPPDATPAITITAPVSGATWRSNVSNNFTWTYSGFTASAPANIQIYTSTGAFYRNYNTGITVGDRSFTIPANTFTAGSYYFNINAGPVSQRSGTFNVMTPTTPPPPATYQLSVSKTGSGTINPSGINSYSSGASVTITANPSSGYTLSSWSGACSFISTPPPSNTCTLTMNSDKTATANFTATPATTYTLTVTNVSPSRGTVTGTGINCGTDCSQSYNSGTLVTLTATANVGYIFSGWGGICTGTTGACTVTMDADNKSVTAGFIPVPVTTYRLTVNRSPVASGAVTSSPTGIDCGAGQADCWEDYNSGTQVTLTANPASGYTFTGWSGTVVCAGTGPCTTTMSQARSATANFTATAPSVTVTAPVSGATWRSNVSNNFTWTYSGFTASAPANIQIYTSTGAFYRNYNTGITVGDRSFTIPANTFTAGSYYFNINAGTVSQRSATFTVIRP